MTDKRKTVTVDITHRSPDFRHPWCWRESGRNVRVNLKKDGELNRDRIVNEVIGDIFNLEQGESLTISIKKN
tara:strand:- start:174 stop:389 length:216 start_codon:yes stop_codon:yes gene_type:complete